MLFLAIGELARYPGHSRSRSFYVLLKVKYLVTNNIHTHCGNYLFIYSTSPAEGMATVLYQLIYWLLPGPRLLTHGSGWISHTLASDRGLPRDPYSD